MIITEAELFDITTDGSDVWSIVSKNTSSLSNTLSLNIEIFKAALVFPAGIVTLNGPDA